MMAYDYNNGIELIIRSIDFDHLSLRSDVRLDFSRFAGRYVYERFVVDILQKFIYLVDKYPVCA